MSLPSMSSSNVMTTMYTAEKMSILRNMVYTLHKDELKEVLFYFKQETIGNKSILQNRLIGLVENISYYPGLGNKVFYVLNRRPQENENASNLNNDSPTSSIRRSLRKNNQSNLSSTDSSRQNVNEPSTSDSQVNESMYVPWNILLSKLETKIKYNDEKSKLKIYRTMFKDNEMNINHMRMSIMDPLTKRVMKMPARGVKCIHLQCFDAINFFKMNEQKDIWKCPICLKVIKFKDIQVDEFFLKIFASPNFNQEYEEIIINNDGTWIQQPINIQENISNPSNKKSITVLTLSDTDSDEEVTKKPNLRKKPEQNSFNENATFIRETIELVTNCVFNQPYKRPVILVLSDTDSE